MSAADRAAHLAGYGAITGVLATATWASQEGRLIALGYLVLAVVFFADIAVEHAAVNEVASGQDGGNES